MIKKEQKLSEGYWFDCEILSNNYWGGGHCEEHFYMYLSNVSENRFPDLTDSMCSNICRGNFVITVPCSDIESRGNKKTFAHRHKTVPDADCFC